MSATAHQIYRFGEFQMDATERELRRADLFIPLAETTFDTLLALVERAGSRVEQEALLRRVWPGGFVDDESLWRTIVTLRKALGTMPDGRSYIETLPRRGCRFAADVEELRELPAAEEVLPISIPSAREAASISHFERAGWVLRAILASALALGIGYWMTALAAELP